MAYLNELTIVGNVGRDAEMRYTAEGKPLTSFSVAVNENKGGESITHWFQITCWEKLAETCAQYVTKGMRVLVKGRVHLRSWVDTDGVNRSGLEVNASKVLFLSNKSENE